MGELIIGDLPVHRRDAIIAGSAAILASTTHVAVARPTAVPVVVELFTSQGCSSCPPADALLEELAQRPEVVAIGWHVDYWNNLGWRDPYARSAWTQRQRLYAQALRDEVYTPAIVVNGTRMVVGSNRAAVQAAIDEAGAFQVSVALRRSANGLVGQIGSRPNAAFVSLLVYDAVNATAVRGGENAGRMLRDSNIARSQTVLEPGPGNVTLPLQEIAQEQGAVLLVQDRSWAVIGVAQVRPASVSPL